MKPVIPICIQNIYFFISYNSINAVSDIGRILYYQFLSFPKISRDSSKSVYSYGFQNKWDFQFVSAYK